MSLPSDVTVDNLKDFYAMILPYLNVGNGGTSDTPLGQVAFFDDVVAPAGWLIADGTVYNISDYPDLATQYERVHGSKNFYGGNGTTTFAVPDLQGEFLRASGTNGHANQGSGAAVGVHQDGTIHANVFSTSSSIQDNRKDSSDSYAVNADYYYNRTQAVYKGDFRVDSTSSGQAQYTSRPTNTSLLLCIKAVPSSEMNTYSTTERRVGTDTDGKHVYQKTFTGLSKASVANSWVNVVDVSSLSISTLREVTYRQTAEKTISVGGSRISDGNLQIYSYVTFGINEVTLLYTKTTD